MHSNLFVRRPEVSRAGKKAPYAEILPLIDSIAAT